jgi:hypothetical protein
VAGKSSIALQVELHMRRVAVGRHSLPEEAGMHTSVGVAGSRPPVAAEQDRAQGPNRCQPKVASARNSKTSPINNARSHNDE